MRHAAGQDLPDDRAHPLLADPDARRDLGDRHAAVEVVDDQLFALEMSPAARRAPRSTDRRARRARAASRQADTGGVLLAIIGIISQDDPDGKKIVPSSSLAPGTPQAAAGLEARQRPKDSRSDISRDAAASAASCACWECWVFDQTRQGSDPCPPTRGAANAGTLRIAGIAGRDHETPRIGG